MSRLAEFVARTKAPVRERLPSVLVGGYGHAGQGNVHFNLAKLLEMGKGVFLEHDGDFNRRVHDPGHEPRGSIAAAHGAGQLQPVELQGYAGSDGYALICKLKTAFAPRDLFNPGKALIFLE